MNKLRNSIVFRITLISLVSSLISFAVFGLILILKIKSDNWEIHVPQPHPNPNVMPWMQLVFTSPILILFVATIIGIIAGAASSSYLNNKFLKPFKELKRMTNEVAKGNFDVEMKNIPQNEIGEFSHNFNIMVNELRKNEMLKKDFISNVSHEFKTPLSVILGYTTLLQDPNISEEERQEYAKVIFEYSSNLSNLVNNILRLSKFDNKKITVEEEEYSLDEQIRESILNLETKWSKKNIELNIELETINICADKELLSIVWNNLIDNSIKFSNENSMINISLVKNDDEAIFVIEDFGKGIKQEEIPYIFDKFYQGEKSRKTDGNGLGLALVKHILDTIQGKITVESSEGNGCKFIITIPIK